MVSTSSITMQSLGKIVDARWLQVRTYGVCMFFVSIFVTLRGRRAVRSRGYTLKRYCVTVHGSILILFSPFSQGIALSPTLERAHFQHHSIREFAVEICENSRNWQKSCVHHFLQIAERFNKIPPQYFKALNVDMHLYKLFLHVTITVARQCVHCCNGHAASQSIGNGNFGGFRTP